MKILAIGNSYSDDTTAYLRRVAAADGVDISAVNLYEGGCSLEKHMDNIRTNRAAYSYEVDGAVTARMVTAEEILAEGGWDAVTIQQASRASGIYESYVPYTGELVTYIRRFCPTAPIFFHRTWSYEVDFQSPWFEPYGYDQAAMWAAILACTERISAEHGLPLIRTGDVIAAIRREAPFDYPHGGISLHRDGFHLSFTYGRLAGALSYYAALTGRAVAHNAFLPEGCEEEKAVLVRRAVDAVYS